MHFAPKAEYRKESGTDAGSARQSRAAWWNRSSSEGPGAPPRRLPGISDLARLDRRQWVTLALVLAVPLAALYAYRAARFAGLTNSDALDLAQLGRNLAAGRGFSTFVLRPLALSHGPDALRQPDLVHGPLYPVLLAAAFAALGARDTVACLVSGLLYVATVPIVYRLSRDVFGRAVARITVLVFALNPMVLDCAVSGRQITLTLLLATALFWVLVRLLRLADEGASDSRNDRLLMAAGALAAALYLTDPILIWLAPVFLAPVVWIQANRARAAALACGTFALLAVPWMARNGVLSGNPIFGLRGADVWMGTRVYPVDSGYRELPGHLAATRELFGALVEKMLAGVNRILTGIPQLSSTWILAFFLPGALFRLHDPASNGLRLAWVAAAAALCAGMLLFGVHVPLLAALLPVALLYSVGFLAHLFKQAKIDGPGRNVACSVIALATLYPLFSDLALAGRARPLPLAGAARLLRQQSVLGDVCVTDEPWAVAWYADRPALWIPLGDDEMRDAAARVTGIRWLVITDRARSLSPDWQLVYDGMADWNAAWRKARDEHGPAPAPAIVGATGPPLMDALNGFESVEPSDVQPSSLVVARVLAPGGGLDPASSPGASPNGSVDPGNGDLPGGSNGERGARPNRSAEGAIDPASGTARGGAP